VLIYVNDVENYSYNRLTGRDELLEGLAEEVAESEWNEAMEKFSQKKELLSLRKEEMKVKTQLAKDKRERELKDLQALLHKLESKNWRKVHLAYKV